MTCSVTQNIQCTPHLAAAEILDENFEKLERRKNILYFFCKIIKYDYWFSLDFLESKVWINLNTVNLVGSNVIFSPYLQTKQRASQLFSFVPNIHL